MQSVDKIILMDQGKILRAGDCSELKAASPNFAMMMEEQMPVLSGAPTTEYNVQNILNKLSAYSHLSMSLIDPEGQQVSRIN